jgi:aminoglycoside phosphotransferase (APT) family kinase protein
MTSGAAARQGKLDEAMTAEAELHAVLARIVVKIDTRLHAIAQLTRLSAGATNETWSFDAVGASADGEPLMVPLILRRATRRAVEVLSLPVEAALLTQVHAARVPVPRVHHVLQPEDGLGAGFVMERIEGATLPSKILRDPALAAIRPRLAEQLGSIAAAIHCVPLANLPQLPLLDAEHQLQLLQSQYQAQRQSRPVFELAFRWLRIHLPVHVAPVLVHGDYRHGNLIIGPTGVHAVLDWELAHHGDPVEDLAWLCLPPWRFGSIDLPVGGFGVREELLAAYEHASGRRVAAERLRWWETLGSLRWGLMCAGMTQTLRSGADRSIERAMIARRASESELDLLRLLAPRTSSPLLE